MLYEQILILCGKSGISIARLEREMHFGNGTIRRWKQGNAGVDKVRQVADYFGVSMDSLLCQEHNNCNTVQ